ncbi:MAG: hypothetical protein AMJ79_13290 [Phycisphaerae bacterium SM23_30]|nr:MAG: hypothetical protein AMJ79_13290 [Phycisphaerae bacterium SM23_30]
MNLELLRKPFYLPGIPVFNFAGTLLNLERSMIMQSYRCLVCGYIYNPAEGDPDNGIEPGTAFEDIPEDWVCPECGAGKDDFEPI